MVSVRQCLKYRWTTWMWALVLTTVLGTGAILTGPDHRAEAARGRRVHSRTIAVGVYLPITGTEAQFGTSVLRGIHIAAPKINSAGGVKGRQIQIRQQDTRSNIGEVEAAVRKLIDRDGVVAVLGDVTSGGSLAGAVLCQTRKVPMITPTATHPDVTRVGSYVFRACFTDSFQGTAMARFVVQSLGLKRVAVLKGSMPYSRQLARSFTTAFQALGGTVVADESYSETDSDFSVPLTAVKEKEPEAIFLPGYYMHAGAIAQQARQLGITVPLLGGDGWASESLFDAAGESLEGSYLTDHYALEGQNSANQQFVRRYRAKHGDTLPDSLAALGYDALRMLVDAMRRARSLDGPALRNALAATRAFPSVTGPLTLDKNRDARRPLLIMQVKGKAFQYVTTIPP